MAFNAEQLNIVIAARTQELQKELGAAERRIKRFEGQTRRNLKRTTKHFDTLGYAAKRLAPILAAAFSVQAVSNMVATASEMGKLADIAGVGVEEFQRFAYGAKTVGIELSNASDILKDVQDRIGDFLSTGGGPMKDFFENVAPLVGVTAEQFARLSGPEALQLYVSSLEKAGLSHAQMTFYMEALANDATALIPLLRNNGTMMRQLGDEAERAGRILSQDAVDGARDLEREMGDLSATIKTQLTEAILDNKDELLALVNFISETAIPAVAGLISTITRALKLYNAARGIDTSDSGAEPDPAVRQADVAAANDLGGGDPSRSGMFVVDANGNIVEAGVPGAPSEGYRIPQPVTAPPKTATGSSARSGGGGGGADPLAELRSLLESERELIDEYRMSEMEKLVADHEMRQQILEEALQKQLLTQEEYNRLKAENQSMHSQEIAKIIAAERSVRLGETANMFSALAGIAEQGGKKLVKTQAILSGAATMIAAYETAMKAAAEATTIPGRIAAYAAFVAKGVQTVAQIKSIGASGSASGGSAGGSIAAPAAPSVSRNVAINLTGGDMYSRDQVINLINGINEAVEDGATLRLV